MCRFDFHACTWQTPVSRPEKIVRISCRTDGHEASTWTVQVPVAMRIVSRVDQSPARQSPVHCYVTSCWARTDDSNSETTDEETARHLKQHWPRVQNPIPTSGGRRERTRMARSMHAGGLRTRSQKKRDVVRRQVPS